MKDERLRELVGLCRDFGRFLSSVEPKENPNRTTASVWLSLVAACETYVDELERQVDARTLERDGASANPSPKARAPYDFDRYVFEGAIERGGFRVGPDVLGNWTLWCLECGRDSGFHHSPCSKLKGFVHESANPSPLSRAARAYVYEAKERLIAFDSEAECAAAQALLFQASEHGLVDAVIEAARAYEKACDAQDAASKGGVRGASTEVGANDLNAPSRTHAQTETDEQVVAPAEPTSPMWSDPKSPASTDRPSSEKRAPAPTASEVEQVRETMRKAQSDLFGAGAPSSGTDDDRNARANERARELVAQWLEDCAGDSNLIRLRDLVTFPTHARAVLERRITSTLLDFGRESDGKSSELPSDSKDVPPASIDVGGTSRANERDASPSDGERSRGDTPESLKGVPHE